MTQTLSRETIKLRTLLKRVLDSADADWWIERDDMNEQTPFEITVPVGLLWEIDETLKERPETTPKDPLDTILSFEGMTEKQKTRAAMSVRVEKSLRVTPDGKPSWDTVMEGLIKREAAGETIEQYAAWCQRDKYNSPKTHQIAQTPNIILNTWRAAFDAVPEQDNSARARLAREKKEMERIQNGE